MRILEVVHGFPPAAQAGAEVYAHAHARTLLDHCGDEVMVLTREADPDRPEYAVRTELRDGLRLVWINNTFRATRTFADTYRNYELGAVASRVIDDLKPDVAHIHHLTCLSTTIVDSLAARNIPCLFTLHDYWLLCHRGQLLDVDHRVCEGPGISGCERCLGSVGGAPRAVFAAAAVLRQVERRLPSGPGNQLRRASRVFREVISTPAEGERQARARLDHMRALCSNVTHFLAPSQYMQERFLQFGVPADRITVAGYGFDHTPFRHLVRTTAPRIRFGFLGSLMVSKAPDVLLEAFARLPRGSASVTLYGPHVPYHGDESYRARLEPLLACDGVHLAGSFEHDRVADVLSAIDVLVVPSIWPENSPLVIHEAFLAGVPVVASRIGGIPEIVEDGVNGFLFHPGDVADLHRVMQRLVDTPSVLAGLSARLPVVRTIEKDVEFARGLYEAQLARGTTSPMRLAAVVLNYRTPDDTLLAVKSLLASRRRIDEIVVVDNDPQGECRAALEGLGSSVTSIRNERNLGFSGGMNVGIRAALSRGADAVLLVNSDVIVPPDCIGVLERCLHHHGTGIVGPVLRSRSDPRRIASLGMRYTASTGRMRHAASGECRGSSNEPAARPVAAVSGCVMLVKRDVFNSIGLFDEDYFFSFEDLDFCLKAREAGYDTKLAGQATAYHEGSRSIGADSSRRFYFATRNHLLLANRRSAPASRIARLVRSVSIVALNVAHAATSTGGTMPSRLHAVARGIRDHVAGRYGNDT